MFARGSRRSCLDLDVVGSRDDVEAAVTPLVPDRREEHAAVSASRGEHRDERLLEQVAEILRPEVLAHLEHRLERGGAVVHDGTSVRDEHALDR